MVRPKRYFPNDTLLALKSAGLLTANSNMFALSVDMLLSPLHGPLPGRRAISAHGRPDACWTAPGVAGSRRGKRGSFGCSRRAVSASSRSFKVTRWRSLPTGASRPCGNRATDGTGTLPPPPGPLPGNERPGPGGTNPRPGHPCVRAFCVGRGPGRRRSAQGVPPVHRGYG